MQHNSFFDRALTARARQVDLVYTIEKMEVIDSLPQCKPREWAYLREKLPPHSLPMVDKMSAACLIFDEGVPEEAQVGTYIRNCLTENNTLYLACNVDNTTWW